MVSDSATTNADSPPLSLREEQKLFTRERMVDAAVQVFGEVGYRGASIEQIAKRAGANRSTFYLHFKSKAELGAAMARRATPGTIELYRRLDEMKSPTCADIRAWMDNYVGIWMDTRVTNEVLFEGMQADVDLAREGNALWERISFRVMKNYLSSFPPEEREAARARFLLIVQMLVGMLHSHILQGHEEPNELLINAASDLIWRNLFLRRPDNPSCDVDSTEV